MTLTTDAGDRVVSLARGMRELVRAEAAESERNRTLTPAIVDEMWTSGLMSAFNPVAAGGVEPAFAEMIETWIEMAWQDGSFGWVGIANLPSSFAAGAYLPDDGFAEVFTAHDEPRHHGRSVLPQRAGRRRRGRLPAHGRVEFRLGHGPRRIRGGRFPADARRRDPLDQRGPARHAGGHPSARRGRLRRRLACAGIEGNRLLRLSRRGRVRARAPDLRVVHHRAAPGYVAGGPDGNDAGDGRRARLVGARRRQEHARRRRGTGRHEVSG